MSLVCHTLYRFGTVFDNSGQNKKCGFNVFCLEHVEYGFDVFVRIARVKGKIQRFFVFVADIYCVFDSFGHITAKNIGACVFAVGFIEPIYPLAFTISCRIAAGKGKRKHNGGYEFKNFQKITPFYIFFLVNALLFAPKFCFRGRYLW